MNRLLVLSLLLCAAGIAAAAPGGLALRLADAPSSLSAPVSSRPLQDRHRLSLQAAIDDAVRRNVQTLLADAARDEAAGSRVEARSAFLPHLSADASQSRQSTNLAAQGIQLDLPGFPSVVTYNNFDARARLRQNLFDYAAWQRYQGAKVGERVAAAQLAVAREQVATQAALDYVSVLAAGQSVAAARADLQLAEHLVELAVDQENVGVATGVDVTRARTRRARASARLAQARTDRNRAEIRLARTAGLPLAAPLTLADRLGYQPIAYTPVDAAVARALGTRPEIELAETQIRRGEKQLAAARGERLPKLSVNAAYGDSGNTYRDNVEDTYSVGAQLTLPIFDGGAIHGRIDSAASRLDQQRIRYRDTRDQVEQDVRLARRTLSTLAEQVESAQSALRLAQRELTLSQDRFAHGISDNVEVIDAQAALADARSTRVDALAEYTRARINLAAALGHAQQFRLDEQPKP